MICRVCDSSLLVPAVDLGHHPWANNFLRIEQVGSEARYPLRVVFCESCQTAQLDHTVPKETMFSNHTYLSGTTRTLRDHFHAVAHAVNEKFFRSRIEKSVLDIGSNDGTQLQAFKDIGFDVLGVESAKLPAEIASSGGIPTIRSFFDLSLARSIDRRFDVINASGVFFHLEDLHSVTEGIRHCLAADGVFVIQFLYMKRIVENDAFDQIYHEHLLYYNIKNVEHLLRRHGLSLFHAELNAVHGGSIVAFASHADKVSPTRRLEKLREAEENSGCNTLGWYTDFSGRIAQRREENLAFLRERRSRGKRIFGLGAPVKGNTLLNYFGIGTELIECLVERNPHRRGMYAPGSHIPLRIEDEILEPPDVYYVLAWNFRDEILARYENLIRDGVEFFFPVIPKESD